jgi:hypothetical protein
MSDTEYREFQVSTDRSEHQSAGRVSAAGQLN